ncbi:MAG TPA: serine hydrolase [Longimicrobiales bacterium]|nr:serine hydrolase [Longimicrobiales bacterium]
MRTLLLLAALALPMAAPALAQQTPVDTPTVSSGLIPTDGPELLGLAGFAKVLCSAVFVSGRDPAEAARNSGYFFLPGAAETVTDTVVDRERKEVRLTWQGVLTRTAGYTGDQGCVIRAPGFERPFFQPSEVRSALPPAESMDWPMGDRVADAPLPAGVDAAKLAAAVDAAFRDPEALTAGFVVVHGGRIIAERYGAGAHRDMQLESWSMGKSIAATLVGRLIEMGKLELHQPAPVPEWRMPGDPRGAITVAHLLNMASGLHFIATQDPDYTPRLGYPDHMYIYSGAIDAAGHSITRPLQFEPGTVGRYRNSDPLTAAWLAQQAARAAGEDPLTWPQRHLFDEVGIRRQVLETDPYGNFLISGYDYGTPRNWARLGLLYLNRGVWQGERLLPEAFVDFVRAPAPGWDEPRYGGFFWLNRTGAFSLPEDAYYMAGAGGQYTFVVPSLDLVVVRMGHWRGSARGIRLMDEALGLLTDALAGSALAR